MKRIITFLLIIINIFSICFNMSINTIAADDKIEKALSWAIEIANDNTHGYLYGGKGPINYDCSGFVCAALMNAGFNISHVGTSNMANTLQNVGFTVYNKGTVTLQRGDILLKPGSHVEFYLGNNQCVAAHSNHDGKSGDSGGKEINIRNKSECDFCRNEKYTYVLRYETTYEVHVHAYSYANEAAHPHRQYRKCTCGHTEYTGATGINWVTVANEAAHPHRQYRKCSCGYTEYTGATNINWLGNSYESAHPHKVYRTCSCGYYEYTGETTAVSSCIFCLEGTFAERKYYNGHTYDVYAINTTWDAAKAFCEQKGGHLVTVTSADEWNFVSSLLDGKFCWLGGYLDGSVWRWVTGESFSYAPWCAGEPSGNGENKLGVYVDNGWNDYYNGSKSPVRFICEYEPYTVKLDANGGQETITLIKTHGVELELTSELPVRSGYKFVGWSTNKDAEYLDYSYGSKYTENKNTTLYAVWSDCVIKTEYDYDGNVFYHSYKLDGVNCDRTTADVILYTSAYGETTRTNEYGCEATVDSTGRVISRVNGVGNASIIDGGFVISGHSYITNGFVMDYVTEGKYVYFDSLRETVYVFDSIDKMQAFLKCSDNSHTPILKNAKEPSYVNGGYSGDSCCSICNQLLLKGKFLDKLPLKDSSSLFTDVNKDAWYKQAIDYAVSLKIMNGISKTAMHPNGDITRAQFVQILANIEGVDTSNKNISTRFADVLSGQWYAPAVKWASDVGIVEGITPTEFDPKGTLTRENMCLMIVRYLDFRNVTLKHNTILRTKFGDDSSIGGWAKDAVYLCKDNGLVQGMGTNFNPKDIATRAQVATIMMRLNQNYEIIK